MNQNKTTSRKVFKFTVAPNDKGTGIIVVWNDDKIFYKHLSYYWIEQEGYKTQPTNNYWHEFQEIDRSKPFTLIAVSKANRTDVKLEGKPFKLYKKEWIFRIKTTEVPFSILNVQEEIKTDKELKDEYKGKPLVLEESGEWIRKLIIIAVLAIGGITIWKKLKDMKT